MTLELEQLIRKALEENPSSENLSTKFFSPEQKWTRVFLIAQDDLVLSGSALFEKSFSLTDPDFQITWHFSDGDLVLKGQSVATMAGHFDQFVCSENIALSFIQRLSGIATLTRLFVEQVEHSSCQIFGSPNHTPLYQDLEDQAIIHGGGKTSREQSAHRVFLDKRHQSFWKFAELSEKIEEVSFLKESDDTKKDLKIEMVANTLEEVEAACDLNVQGIILDNMSHTHQNDTLKAALKIIPHNITTTVTGVISLEEARTMADLKVNRMVIDPLPLSAPTALLSLSFAEN